MNMELWQKTIEHHGHKCVGLAFGFRMGEEAKKIFGTEEKIYCRLPVNNCILDGIAGALDAFGDPERVQLDTSLKHFVFYVENDEEGWAFTQKKMELPEGTDPVAAVLTFERDMVISVEPCDL